MNVRKNPLISVVIPFFNTEKYFSECLNSVINQTYKNIEIILVDDESTDVSLDIAKKFAKNDSRIKIIEQKNTGQAIARRNGFKKSTGKYICFVDSDDIVNKTYVYDLFNALNDNKTEISAGGVMTFADNSIIKNVNKKSNKNHVEFNLIKCFVDNYRLLSDNNIILQSMNAKLFSRKLLNNIDYSVIKTNVLEDNLIMAQILKKVSDDKISISENVIYFYRTYEESTMGNVFNKKIDYGLEKLNYTEIFRKTMQYIRELFSDNKDIDKLICKLEVEQYYIIANSITDKNIYIDLLLEERSQNESRIKHLEDEVKIIHKEAQKIVNSRSYKMTQKILKILKLGRS